MAAGDAAELSGATAPYDDFVVERAGPSVDANGRPNGVQFEQADGPFSWYRRRVITDEARPVEVTEFSLRLPWFSWLFTPIIWWTMRSKSRGAAANRGRQPWWAPPDRFTERHVYILGLLAAASLISAFVNTIFTQTAAVAAEGFHVGNQGQGTGGAIVRMGILLTFPIAMLADRVGRRKMIQICAFAAPSLCALGAVAPTFPFLVATQTLARPVGLTLDLLIAIVAAEEMGKNSRAYAVSLLAMASGLGAGVCVWTLKLADFGRQGWRLVYLVSLIWLVVAVDIARRLPETTRFTRQHAVAPPFDRRRFWVQASVAFFGNIFLAAASFFQNRYLKDVRGFDAGRVALFTLVTATPAGIGILVGGKLAERHGRRRIGALSVFGGTILLVASFGVRGWQMWACALVGGLIAGASVPAIAVYRAEVFPTARRGSSAWWVTTLALLGGSIGILAAGRLLDQHISHVRVMGALALGEIVVILIVLMLFPETAHRTLEELNPVDAEPLRAPLSR
jgi:MFS family permease